MKHISVVIAALWLVACDPTGDGTPVVPELNLPAAEQPAGPEIFPEVEPVEQPIEEQPEVTPEPEPEPEPTPEPEVTPEPSPEPEVEPIPELNLEFFDITTHYEIEQVWQISNLGDPEPFIQITYFLEWQSNADGYDILVNGDYRETVTGATLYQFTEVRPGMWSGEDIRDTFSEVRIRAWTDTHELVSGPLIW